MSASKRLKGAGGKVVKKVQSDDESSDDENIEDPFFVEDDDEENLEEDDDGNESDVDIDKIISGAGGGDDDDDEEQETPEELEARLKRIKEAENFVDCEEEDDNTEFQEQAKQQEQSFALEEEVFVPDTKRAIPKNFKEEFQFNNGAYEVFHRLKTDWPCLSFDVVKDNLGVERTSYPMTAFCVAGLQAKDPLHIGNGFHVFKMSDMYRTKYDSDSEGDDDEEEDQDIPAKVDNVFVQTKGCVNRIKCMPQNSNIVACWTSIGLLQLYDISQAMNYLQAETKSPNPGKLVHQKALNCLHKSDGWALGWSSLKEGLLASGDRQGKIYVYQGEGSDLNFTKTPPRLYQGHEESVEDIQWSPTESTVFATCSVDRTVAVWDTRKSTMAMRWKASNTADINVISWNKLQTTQLASGSDDGLIQVWDVKKLGQSPRETTKAGTIVIKSPQPIAQMDYHKHPITSMEWHPTDETVLAVTCEDNQSTVWDFSVEADEEQHTKEVSAVKLDLPPQLVFLHMGQYLKDFHWHPQVPNLAMVGGYEGVALFKPVNMCFSEEEIAEIEANFGQMALAASQKQ